MAFPRYLPLTAVAVTLLAGCAYAATIAPSITWQHSAADSGELAAAAYSFGVPHPTGYPLWLLLATAWARLPLGADVAGRLNWLSATCAALASGLLTVVTALLVNRASPAGHPNTRVSAADTVASPPAYSLLAGATAGVALLTATGVWNVAVVTETYTLHLLLVVALLGATLLGRRQRWRALLGGLALANHVTVLPVAAATLLSGHGRTRLRPINLLWLVPGLALYLLLPWRAHSHPVSNWGDPETAGALWALVSGSAYHYLLVWPSLTDGVARFLASLHALVTQFPLPFWPLALAGLPTLYGIGRLWLLIGALYLLLPVLYRATGVEHYLLPDLVLLALAAGFGAERFATALAQWRLPSPTLPWLLLAVLTVPALIVGARTSSLRGDDSARQWATQLLHSAKQDDELLTTDDEETFALWYVQRVEGVRPDVTVVDERLLQQPWYRRQLNAYH